MKSTIEFINHASVIVSNQFDSILSDPWYEGSVFEKGWQLIYENDETLIKERLNKINYIWISHEHPDHFSISFFKKYKESIQEKKITILFQKRKDGRVINFLKNQGFLVKELPINKWVNLSHKTAIKCFQEGIYDSGCLIESNGDLILNLNDCDITEHYEGNRIRNLIGNRPVEVLLTQFSYAGWKGGKENKKWRTEAAKEKIDTIRFQVSTFEPKFIIPFASFSFFSNKENYYLNDSVNTPSKIFDSLHSEKIRCLIMSPYDKFDGIYSENRSLESIEYWKEKYEQLKSKELLSHERINQQTLSDNFYLFTKRIFTKNSIILIKVIHILSLKKLFSDINIYITDYCKVYKVSLFKNNMRITDENPDISIKSGMLNFIFKFSYGFDTLVVNGCFEEKKSGGFFKASRCLGIEVLNNMGFFIKLKSLISPKIIFFILKIVRRVKQKL